MKHEALLGLAFEDFQPLHIFAGAQRRSDQSLRLTAGEDRRPVGTRQRANFHPDGPDLIKSASKEAGKGRGERHFAPRAVAGGNADHVLFSDEAFDKAIGEFLEEFEPFVAPLEELFAAVLDESFDVVSAVAD